MSSLRLTLFALCVTSLPGKQNPTTRAGSRTSGNRKEEMVLAKRVFVLVGTRKGAFILEAGADRKSWELKGPFCATWPMNHVVGDAATGTIYGAGGNEWFGPAVWKSTDLGESWTHSR